MINPTGREVRNDAMGFGKYGASRGSRKHRGVDFVAVPGQAVLSPINGTIARVAKPYANDDVYLGLVITNPSITIKLFYIEPIDKLIEKKVNQGDVIGFAQNVANKHGPEIMIPHVHLEVVSIDPTILIDLF